MDTLIGTVPNDWQMWRLDDCCRIQPGPSGTVLKPSAHISEGVPVVTARDVDPDGVSPNPRVRVSTATAQRLQRYQLRPGDIILVRVGVTTRYTTVTDQQDGWLLGGSCFSLRVLKGTSPEYLAYYLAHPAVQDWLTEHTQRGVMPTLSKHTIGELPLVLPPAALQQDILHTAKIIDTKIRAHQDVIQATLTLRELLLPRLLAGDPNPLNLQPTPPGLGHPANE